MKFLLYWALIFLATGTGYLQKWISVPIRHYSKDPLGVFIWLPLTLIWWPLRQICEKSLFLAIRVRRARGLPAPH